MPKTVRKERSLRSYFSSRIHSFMLFSQSATVVGATALCGYRYLPRWGQSNDSEAAVISVLRQQFDRCGPENLTCPPPSDACPLSHLSGALVVGGLVGVLSITWCAIGWYILRARRQCETPARDFVPVFAPEEPQARRVQMRVQPLAIELSRDAARVL